MTFVSHDGSSWHISFALHMLAHFVIGLLVGLIVTVLSLQDIGKAKVGPFEFDRIVDQPLIILKKILHQLEQRTHSKNAYKFSQRATLAAGW
jgi:hypothetical protein